MIDQTLPLTVENIPLKKKVFSGIGFELDGGREIRGVIKSPQFGLFLATVERRDRFRSQKIANDNVTFEFAFFPVRMMVQGGH